MYVACVTIWVKPGGEEQFVEATKRNHENTRREPGNLRFDVLKHESEPGRFMLYEVYQTPDDFAAHQKTAHYLAWKEAVADLMAQPRQGHKHMSLFPCDKAEYWTGG
ncbi:MAG: antibiotic biosynthesis monooxygenase [Candidatus Aminicenantes bacterium]|nr:antibiotic biosynthesis monooxygenase [Candidatus Aminicenantes bacterium]